MVTNLFNSSAFFIILRETLECTIIVSVLLGLVDKFIPPFPIENQQLRILLKKRIWIGIIIGFFLSIIIGAVFITIFYIIDKSGWERTNEIWDTILSFVATILITIMIFSMIRVTNWRHHIEDRLNNFLINYYVYRNNKNQLPLSLLPFITICRETLEAFILIAGIGTNNPTTSLPIPVITGLLLGLFIGYLIYKGFKYISLKIFFILTTILLFFTGAGLFSTACDQLQKLIGTKEIILWNLNCCDPSKDSGWSIAKTLFGWNNKATTVTIISYFSYWIVVLSYFLWIYIRDSNKVQQEQQQQRLPDNDNIVMQEV